MPWQDGGVPDLSGSVARWSAGRKWGDGSRWLTSTTPRTSGPINVFAIAIGGVLQRWQAASWSLGRTDWFGTLTATNAGIQLRGYAIPAIGASVVISDADRLYWVGAVETATADQTPDGEWVTNVSCVDTVGRLGKAEVKNASIPSGTLVDQVTYLLGLAGIAATVTQDLAISLPTLDAVSPFTGAVMEHIARAERSSNALVFMRPNGDLRVTQRVALPDYGARVVSGLYAPIPNSHWRLDESVGNFTDTGMAGVTGNAAGFSGTRGVEGPWGPDGPVGIEFDGSTNSYVTFGDYINAINRGSFTAMAWIRWDGTQAGCVFDKRDSGSTAGWSIQVTSDGRFKGIRTVSGVEVIAQSEAGVVPGDGSWCHVAFVYDGTDLRITVNGATEVGVTDTRNLADTTNLLTLGRLAWANGERFDGAISQASVWTSALTDDQIQALMSGGIDLSGDASPARWSVSLSQDTVINSWQLTKADGTPILTEDHAASIAAYGLRAYSVTDYLLGTYAHFPSGLRTATEEPRLVLSGAPFPVLGYQSHRVLGLEPLDIVGRDGQVWQVMSVDHQLTPAEWTVTITGDATRDQIASAILTPPPPPPPPEEPDPEDPDPPPGTTTVTLTYDATRDTTAYRSPGGAYYGNGTGDRLQVGYWAGGRGRAFIRFPISWPAGFIRVKKAYLKLRTSGQDWVGFGSSPRMYVQRVKESWPEGSYDAAPPSQFSDNATNWPGPARTTSGQKVKDVTRSENTWVEVVITDIAQAWHDIGNDGLALVSANEDSSSRTTEFHSRETGSEPRLILVCEVEA